MQIHYDNPVHDVGQIDNSGIRLHYETTLRPIEAGVLSLGDPAVSNFKNPIKAGTGLLEYEYDCPSACTSKWNQTLHVFGNFLHMHKIGAQMWGKQWRNGQLVREMNRIDFWDFGLQQMTPEEHTIEPGDRISTHCIYQQQSADVIFGESSSEEMCIQFVYYYPRSASGFGFCGYFADSHLPFNNVTVCGNDAVMRNASEPMYNPTELDPVGGTYVAFGKPNPNSFKCGIASSTQQSQSTEKITSHKEIDIADNTAVGLVGSFLLIIALLI
jgi:hypothetical protein